MALWCQRFLKFVACCGSQTRAPLLALGFSLVAGSVMGEANAFSPAPGTARGIGADVLGGAWLGGVDCAVVVLERACFLWALLRRPAPVVVPAPESVARRALAALRDRPEEAALVGEVSRIFRRYLQFAFRAATGGVDHHGAGAGRCKPTPRAIHCWPGRSAISCDVAMSGSLRRTRAGRSWRRWRAHRNCWSKSSFTGCAWPQPSRRRRREPAFRRASDEHAFPISITPCCWRCWHCCRFTRSARPAWENFPHSGSRARTIARAAGGAARAAAGRLLVFLRLLAVGLVIVALAGPRMVNDRTETESSGVDIMLVLDLSWSMMSLDMGGHDEEGTRFGIASSVLEDFIGPPPQ